MDATALREDHRLLLSRVRRFTEDMAMEPLDAGVLSDRIRDLGSRLKCHFEAERSCLYGRLMASEDPTTRALATACRQEAQAAEEALRAFLAQWRNPQHIAQDPEGFRLATRDLFQRIGRRTGIEERELLPRLEKAS